MPGAGVERQQRAVGEGDPDAGGVAAVADRLRPRGGDRAARAPELDLHQCPVPLLEPAGQKTAIAPCEPCAVRIGKAETSIRCARAVDGADLEVGVGGAAVADRDDERQLVVGDRLAVLVEGTEERAPLVGPDRAELLEALAQQHSGGLVVEDEDAALVDQECRRRERGHQVASEDQLEGLLLRHR